MTTSTIVALFTAMIILAAIPSVSVLAVSTRSATLGFIHGLLTTMGIVIGDLIFIMIAIGGLSIVVNTSDRLFFLIKYLGGIYLILLGIGLCRTKVKITPTDPVIKSSLISSFLTGLLITLADQKAILFYLGFFPTFLDIAKITYFDTILIMLITIFSVGGVKLSYAFMADRTRLLMSPNFKKSLNIIAGCVMIAVGLLLIIKP